jgi:hypothetical protein
MTGLGEQDGAMTSTTTLSQERSDLIETLTKHRALLERTVSGLTDEQAAARTTVSELCLGGIIKHVAIVEAHWADFIVNGSTAGPPDRAAMETHAATFRMEPGETLAGLLDTFHEVAARTDALVATYPSLDDGHPLPPAPWFPPGTAWSARRSILHVIAETAQHAGHADIVREAIDGQKTMG